MKNCRLNQHLSGTVWNLLCLFCLLSFLPWGALAQTPGVSGNVSDSQGQSIPGVSVRIKGTNKGTSTNNDGKFRIEGLERGIILVFSNVGFKTQELTYTGQSSLKITLEDDNGNLDEVIVVGYGTQKKINVTGAIDQLSGKVLESRPVANIMQGLQGMSPGLNITYGNGAPGSIPNINIRGTTSINESSPLFVIDGIPVSDTYDLIRLSPNDIASYTILKDASSAAIYGARAAFGVILITTKKGTAGNQRISYNVNTNWGKPTSLPEPVTDPYIFSRVLENSTNSTPWDYINFDQQYYEWAKERSDDPSIPEVRVNPQDTKYWEYMGDNNWYDYFLNDATFSQTHTLTFSGGASLNAMPISYYLSGDFTKENGLNKLSDDYWQRKGLRGRLSFSPLKWLKVDNNMNIYQTNRKVPNASLTDMYYLQPTDVAKNPDGSWANTSAGDLAALLVDGGGAGENMFGFQDIANVVGTFLNGDLTVTGDASFKREYWDYPSVSKKYKIGYGPGDIREEGGDGYVSDKKGTVTNDVYNLYANYSKHFGIHAFSVMAGYNQESYEYSTITAKRLGIISSTLPYLALTSGEQTTGASYSSYATRSVFGRLNYTLNDRYILEGTGRYDGSSRFPSSNRWGFFPSVSAAWIASNESFIEKIKPVLSTFKLRASFGSLGNQAVDNFSYVQTMGTGLSGTLIDGSQQQVITGAPGLTVDPDTYTWEKATTLNFGTDLGLFNDKIFAVFDIYQRKTTGMLTSGAALPGVLGTSVPEQNLADLQTNGWELSLAYKDHFQLASKPFNFQAKVVLSDSKAHITKFQNDQGQISDYYNGYQFGQLFGLKSDGFFQNQQEIDALDETKIVPWGALTIVPGWPKYKDLDGDGTIQKGTTLTDLKDLTIIGNTSDRYRIGFNLSMDWNGFDASIFLQGVLKRDFYPGHYLFWGPYQQPYGNVYPWNLDYYRASDDSPEQMAQHSKSYIAAGLANANLDAKYPVLQSWMADASTNLGLDIPQTNYLMNGAYLRIKNITIGYTLPTSLTQRIKISRLRFYATAENIFEFSATKKFVDPEAINNNPGDNSAWAYPFQRKIALGLNFDF